MEFSKKAVEANPPLVPHPAVTSFAAFEIERAPQSVAHFLTFAAAFAAAFAIAKGSVSVGSTTTSFLHTSSHGRHSPVAPATLYPFILVTFQARATKNMIPIMNT